MSAEGARLSLALRASALVHLVQPDSVPTSGASGVLVRLRELASGLEAIADASIAHLVGGWSNYAALLQPVPPVADVRNHASALLEQHDELVATLRELEAIQTLEPTLAPAANRTLSSKYHFDPHTRPPEQQPKILTQISATGSIQQQRIHEATQRADEDQAAANMAAQSVLALANSWAQYTSSVSEAFLLLDSQVSDLERTLSRLERA